MAEALHISANRRSVVCGYFDGRLKPVATVQSGDEVLIDTLNGHVHELPTDPRFKLLPEHRALVADLPRWPGGHLLTGPVSVEDARIGDVLEVRIEDVLLRQNWGYTVVEPLSGTLPEDFPEARLYHISLDQQAGTADLPWGGHVPLRPFFGIIAVAPPRAWGRISSVIPRAHGGNMDCKDLAAGTTLFLPVHVEGALFSVGDGHAAQGDGEVCATALETSLSGRFRLTLRRDLRLAQPRAETPSHLVTFGFDDDLDRAVRHALRDMLAWLGDTYGLGRTDAYALCSLAADLRVTQTVNTAKGVHCMLPKAVVPG